MMITSKLTAKAQTTIPQPVRIALGLAPGDSLSYEIIEDRVVLRRREPALRAPPQESAADLSEWNDPENDVFDRL